MFHRWFRIAAQHPVLIEYLLFALIFVCGFALRFTNFTNYVRWDSDIERDYQQGILANSGNYYPLFGHANSGLNYYYPPLYFYICSLIVHINSNVFFFLIVMSVVNSTSVLWFYIFLKQLSLSITARLFGLALFTFSGLMVTYSQWPMTASFGFTVFLASLAIFYYGLRSNTSQNVIFCSLGISILAISLAVFYESILFFPLYLCLYMFREHGKKTKPIITIIKTLGIAAVGLAAVLLLYSPLIQQDGVLPYLGYRTHNSRYFNMSQGILYFADFVQQNFPWLTVWWSLFIGILLFPILLLRPRVRKLMFMIAIIAALHIVMISFIKTLLFHYFVLLSPYVFLIPTHIVNEYVRYHSKAAALLVIIIISIVSIKNYLIITEINTYILFRYAVFQAVGQLVNSKYQSKNVALISDLPYGFQNKALQFFLNHKYDETVPTDIYICHEPASKESTCAKLAQQYGLIKQSKYYFGRIRIFTYVSSNTTTLLLNKKYYNDE